MHPIKTFTDAGLAAQTFPGTYCGAEGDLEALKVLKPAFAKIGAKVLDISPELKPIYHSGGVFACNYLAALIEAALRAHEKAGIPRAASLKALEPMVRETVDAIFDKGPERALTGPISRGDVATVRRQLAMVRDLGRGTGRALPRPRPDRGRACRIRPAHRRPTRSRSARGAFREVRAPNIMKRARVSLC